MNILYDNIIFSLQKSGGISVVWAELVKRILSSENNISFLEYDHAKENSVRNNIIIPQKLIQHRPSKLLSLTRYFSPNKKITENTIFHSSYYRVYKHPKVANITYVHDFTYEYYRKGPAKYLHILQKKYALNNSDLIICVSQSTKRDLQKFFPNISEKKIKVVYNGVSQDFYNIEKNYTDLKLPFEQNSYLLYVGDRRGEYKNFQLLLKSLPQNINLVISGGGKPTKKELKVISENLTPQQYKFTGYVTNEQLNVLYNNAKALIYPSLYEGFGIPILEAQKAGCPVIALHISSIPEVAGLGAILLPVLNTKLLNEAVERLNIPQFRKYILNTAFENVKKFSWDNSFTQVVKAYNEVWGEKLKA